jgi:hypothetical protein
MITWRSSLGVLIVAVVLAAGLSACTGNTAGTASSTEPWGENIVKPADLVAELAKASGADKPAVVCTAPPFPTARATSRAPSCTGR